MDKEGHFFPAVMLQSNEKLIRPSKEKSAYANALDGVLFQDRKRTMRNMVIHLNLGHCFETMVAFILDASYLLYY